MSKLKLREQIEIAVTLLGHRTLNTEPPIHLNGRGLELDLELELELELELKLELELHLELELELRLSKKKKKIYRCPFEATV